MKKLIYNAKVEKFKRGERPRRTFQGQIVYVLSERGVKIL